MVHTHTHTHAPIGPVCRTLIHLASRLYCKAMHRDMESVCDIFKVKNISLNILCFARFHLHDCTNEILEALSTKVFTKDLSGRGVVLGKIFLTIWILPLAPHIHTKVTYFWEKQLFPFLKRNVKVSKIKFHTTMSVSSREISNKHKEHRCGWWHFLFSSLLFSITRLNLFLVSWEGLEMVCSVAFLFPWLREFTHINWTVSN
jgi:hypothetical protein